MDPTKARISFLGRLLRDVDKVAEYKGKVFDIIDKEAILELSTDDQPPIRKRFPLERLEEIGAAYHTAPVSYDMYSIGPYNISMLQCMKSPKEAMQRLSQPIEVLSEEAEREFKQ